MTPPAATAAPTRALPRTAVPRAPRRVSGPATRNLRDRPADRRDDSARRARTRPANEPFAVRAIHRAQRMADSRFLDRLIRGRLWIPLVAAGLMGIVFMQVTMLKFNAGIGRAVTSAGTLEQQNSTLRADVSRLESGSRVDSVAHDLGMVVPADGTTAYVSAARGQAREAVTKMTPADPAAVQRAQAGDQLAQGQAAGTLTTGSATAAPAPYQAQVQAQTGATPPVTPTTPTPSSQAATGTAAGAGTTTGTTGTTASTPPAAVAQAPSGGTATTAGTTGATTGTAATGTAASGTGTASGGTAAGAPATTTQQQTASAGAAVAPQG